MDYRSAANWCYYVLARRNPVLPPIRRAATAARHLEAIRACTLVDQWFLESPAAKLWAAGELLDESPRIGALTGLRFGRMGEVERYTARKFAEFIFKGLFDEFALDKVKVDAWVYMYQPIFNAATRPVNEEDMGRALALMRLIPDSRAFSRARFVAHSDQQKEAYDWAKAAWLASRRLEDAAVEVEFKDGYYPEIIITRRTVGPMPHELASLAHEFEYDLVSESDRDLVSVSDRELGSEPNHELQ